MAWNIRSCVYKPTHISVARWQGSRAGFLTDLPWPRPANKSLHSFNNLGVYFHQEAQCSTAMQEALSWAPWLPPPLRRKVAHSNPLIKKLPVLVETNQNIYSNKSKLKKHVNLITHENTPMLESDYLQSFWMTILTKFTLAKKVWGQTRLF